MIPFHPTSLLPPPPPIPVSSLLTTPPLFLTTPFCWLPSLNIEIIKMEAIPIFMMMMMMKMMMVIVMVVCESGDDLLGVDEGRLAIDLADGIEIGFC